MHMKKDVIFPDKYLKCAHLKGKSVTLTITAAPLETLKNTQGEEQHKIVLHFAGTKKMLPLNVTNFDAVADVCGEDTDDWPGKKVELYPSVTQMGGKTVECIRVRSPAQRELAPKKPEPEPVSLAKDLDDEIPF
jgi:hypothetical protein